MYIIISAYKAQNFIEACLDAACKQGNVLLGIDGCPDTLEKVKKIRGKYDTLRVFNFPENKGIYMTLNALIDHVPEDELFMVFGADDVMHEGMVEKMARNMPCYSRHTGVMCISKELWNEMGGFRPWRVHADTDFIRRMRLKYTVPKIKKLYFRRRHPNQLTKRKATGLKSKLRNEMRALTKANLESKEPKMYFKPEKNVGQEI